MKTLSRKIGLAMALMTLMVTALPAVAADAPLDTLREASAPDGKTDPRYAGAAIDISRKQLPAVTASSVPIYKSPNQPPRLDDPIVGRYRYHLARQAAVAGNTALLNTNMKAALQAAPDHTRYQWWQSVQAIKRMDTATLAKTLPGSFHSMMNSPVGRGPFVIAVHQAALLFSVFFWSVLVLALYFGWWRNIAHDIGAMLLKNPNHTPRMVLPLLLPLLILAFKPGWLGFLAVMSIPLMIQTRGRTRGLLLASWLVTMALVFPSWSALRVAAPTIDPGSEVTLLDEAMRMPPSGQLTSDLNSHLSQAKDPARVARLTVALAIQEARRGNYTRSNKIFTQVLKKDPNNFAAMVGRANNIYFLGRMDEAAKAYEAAAAAHPDRGEVPYNIAQVYFKKLFVPEAGEALDKARALGYRPITSDDQPTTRGGYSAVVYPPLTADEMMAACRFEADLYPPLVTISTWQPLLGASTIPLYMIVGIPFIISLMLVMWWSRQNDPRNCDNCGTPLCGNCCLVQDTNWLCAGCGETAERSKSDMVLITLLKNRSRAEGMAHGGRIVSLGKFLPGAAHFATDQFWAGWLRVSLLATGLFLIFGAWAFDPSSELATPGLQLPAEVINPMWFPMPSNLWPGWSGVTILAGLAMLAMVWIIAFLDGPGLRGGITDRYSMSSTTASSQEPVPHVGLGAR